MMNERVCVASFRDHNLAALVRSRLEAAGIDVYIPFEHTSALRIPFVFSVQRLYVHEDDAKLARSVLESTESDEADAGLIDETSSPRSADACPHCGGTETRALPPPLWPSVKSLFFGSRDSEDEPLRWHCANCDAIWEENAPRH